MDGESVSIEYVLSARLEEDIIIENTSSPLFAVGYLIPKTNSSSI